MTRYAMGAFKPHTNKTPLPHMGPLHAVKFMDATELVVVMLRNLRGANSVTYSGYSGRVSFVHNRFYSYDTCVAMYHRLENRWVFDNTLHGPTTSKHLEDLRREINHVAPAPVWPLPNVQDIGSHDNVHYAITATHNALLAVANKRFGLPRRTLNVEHAKYFLALTQHLLNIREGKVGASGEPVLYEHVRARLDVCLYAMGEPNSEPDPDCTIEAIRLRNARLNVTAMVALEG